MATAAREAGLSLCGAQVTSNFIQNLLSLCAEHCTFADLGESKRREVPFLAAARRSSALRGAAKYRVFRCAGDDHAVVRHFRAIVDHLACKKETDLRYKSKNKPADTGGRGAEQREAEVVGPGGGESLPLSVSLLTRRSTGSFPTP